MNKNDFFHLAEFAGAWSGYYMDEHGEIWSTKLSPDGIKLNGTTNRYGDRYFTLNGVKYKEDYIKNLARPKFEAWMANRFWAAKCQKSVNGFTESVKSVAADIASTVRLIIGSEVNGVLSFSSNPKIHRSWDSAKAEAERLARTNVGKRFVIAELKASVVVGGVNWS